MKWVVLMVCFELEMKALSEVLIYLKLIFLLQYSYYSSDYFNVTKPPFYVFIHYFVNPWQVK